VKAASREKVESRKSRDGGRQNDAPVFRPPAPGPRQAFTLIELLVVITILGILAALSVPALKNLGKSNSNISASRQLLDGVGRARQLAIANRTTVYMVFVPTNFWGVLSGTNYASAAATNLCDKQLTGYAFVSHGQLGDQPGQHSWHYLEPWQNLPDDSFIAAQKFLPPASPLLPINIPQWQSDYNRQPISAFTNLSVPFPTEGAPDVSMPCIAFDYSGKLISEADASGNYHDAYIPLAQGTVFAARDPNSKAFQFAPADVTENPPGNSTGISYNVIHIDALTGRAVLEFYKMK
jgi:prepilin-type N-terminal cleavage/methylation domain-containing protein